MVRATFFATAKSKVALFGTPRQVPESLWLRQATVKKKSL